MNMTIRLNGIEIVDVFDSTLKNIKLKQVFTAIHLILTGEDPNGRDGDREIEISKNEINKVYRSTDCNSLNDLFEELNLPVFYLPCGCWRFRG